MAGTRRRAGQLALLTLAAGIADAIGYVTMGGVFAANMTGNTVLTGIAAVERDYAGAWHRFVPLLGFFLGAMVGHLLYRLARTPAPALAVEAMVLALVGLASIDPALAIVIVAGAMGLQASAGARPGPVAVSTVVVTSTIARLADALVDRLWTGREADPPAVQAPGLLALTWACYLAGAVIGAALLPLATHPLLVPAAILLLALIV